MLPKVDKGLCRWCKEDVPKPRRTWCGDECVNEYLVRNNRNDACRLVEERDQGVCTLCGLDTLEIKALRDQCSQVSKWSHYYTVSSNHTDYEGYHGWWYKRFSQDWGSWAKPLYTLWEADHIIPVIEGGGCCGLDNLRTLCVACHRMETAALAGRRAQKRKENKNQSTMEFPN